MAGGCPQKGREALFVRFIASGLIAYMHDQTWWMIFGSQLSAMDALNSGVLRREEIEEFYNAAVRKFPGRYENYSFEQWLGFLRNRVLVLDLPGNTIGITVRGKDFLKHLIHYGYSRSAKSL
jgi:hypothetical protein